MQSLIVVKTGLQEEKTLEEEDVVGGRLLAIAEVSGVLQVHHRLVGRSLIFGRDVGKHGYR